MCINRENIDDTNTLAAHAIDYNLRTKAGFFPLYNILVLKYEEYENLANPEQFSFKNLGLVGLTVSILQTLSV